MQLNEILEENSIKAMSQKTKISEENLQKILNANFDSLRKIRTLGFISIVEREYKTDLGKLREEALEYYRQHEENSGFSPALAIAEERKKKSIWFILIILAILGYASWYFFTQFDKKHLNQIIPFINGQQIERVSIPNVENEQENAAAELNIENIMVDDTEADVAIEKTLEDANAENENYVKER
ncbi:hypothetical protein [Sulfurovum sp.]|uniref:hypothetical protein n=1 Tax=Sulfurovum sp. TaxID=1969726 RepID=UPI0028682466|nr:hypothetical protein [Sulfurovum sp.]